ncbi:hypothetical protein GCM10010975_30330 [Comamonas phosphati]|nr:hypothetical protein GCM10010975_30330 [Comamonas phosphati]
MRWPKRRIFPAMAGYGRLLPVPLCGLGMAPDGGSAGVCAGGTLAPLEDAGGFICGAGALFLSQAVSAAAAATSTRGVSSVMSDFREGMEHIHILG